MPRRFTARTIRTFAFLLAAVLLSSCDRPSDANIPGPAQGEVVVYCSVDQHFAKGILAGFEKQTGVRVLARYDEEARKTTGLVQRLRAEKAHPAADVFWSGEIFQTIRLAEEGILRPYQGEAVKGWPPQFADPDGRWFAFALRMRVIAWDTRRVKADEVPQRLEDLLGARWKGRLVMARPQFGTTRGDVASWFAHYGPGRAKEVLRGLAANGMRLVQGNSTAVRTVARGEADVCFTDTDDVYVAQRNGWPIAMTPLDQDGEGALAIPNTAGLVAGGPSPAAGEKLLAYLLSEGVERALAGSDSRNTPIRARLAAEFPANALGKALKVDYAKVAAQMPAAMDAVREIFP
ncbi:MAG TPA: extracellular solute-binding protein [Phycisphaerae bacterium]|nr:extracellular solute-binding protein [Phycisphaerae bacterium]